MHSYIHTYDMFVNLATCGCASVSLHKGTVNSYIVSSTSRFRICAFSFNHDKSLMFKYGRIQKKISPQLVCGSHVASLDCMLPGVQVTAGLGFFSVFSHLSDSEDSDSLI